MHIKHKCEEEREFYLRNRKLKTQCAESSESPLRDPRSSQVVKRELNEDEWWLEDDPSGMYFEYGLVRCRTCRLVHRATETCMVCDDVQVWESSPGGGVVKAESMASVVGDRVMIERGGGVSGGGQAGASSVVLEGDLVGLLCGASGGGRGTVYGIPNKISATPLMADSHPEGHPRYYDAIIKQLTTVSPARLAGDVSRSYVVRRHVDPGVGIGATKGLSGCRWKVQVVWMLEEKLAKMQIDAEITDVTSEESANPGWRRKACWLRVTRW